MKKSLFFAAMACIAFAGCTEDEVFNTDLNQERAIAFSAPVVTPNTRAAVEVGKIYDPGLKFNVWGWWYESDAFNNYASGDLYIKEATASYDGNTWYPKNTEGGYYYWPKNGSMTFLAYSPASDKMKTAAEVDAGGLTLNDYVVSTKPSEMEDVMFSERVYDKISSTDNTYTGADAPYDGVDLLFRHALSSVVFNLKLDKEYKGTQVRIKSITLEDVASKATFKQNLDDESGATTNLPTTTGTSTNSDNAAAWTGQDVKVDYSVDIVADGYVLNNDASPAAYWPCTGGDVEPVYHGTDDNKFRYTDLMLIPQDLDGVTLKILYTIKTTDSAELDQVFTNTFTSSDIWKIGYRYIYNVTIGFDPITFAPKVSLWVDATSTDVLVEDYE